MNDRKQSRQIANAYKLIEILAGHEFEPLRTRDVARAMGFSDPQATRYLQQAEMCGWVEKTPDERWRLRARMMTNIAVAVQHGIQRAKSSLNDQANNFTRSTH